MADENQYRERLSQAQQALDSVTAFLTTMKSEERTKADTIVSALIDDAERRANSLVHDLDRIWDLFKRPLGGQREE